MRIVRAFAFPGFWVLDAIMGARESDSKKQLAADIEARLRDWLADPETRALFEDGGGDLKIISEQLANLLRSIA